MTEKASEEEERRHLEGLLVQKRELLRQVREVEEQLLVSKVRLARMHNSDTAVYKLPNELLSAILQTVYDDYQGWNVRSSHVCAHWRSVALATPLMWKDVRVVFTQRRREDVAEMLCVHLTRSSLCPLNLSIDIQAEHLVLPVLELLAPHAERWHRVSVTIPNLPETVTSELYAPLRELSTPVLVHFSLCHGPQNDPYYEPRTQYPTTTLPILSHGSPLLSFVRLAGLVVGRLAPPFSSVSTLHIEAWPKNIMTLAQFRSLFATLPCLVHLSLTGLSIQLPLDPLDVSAPILIPSLRSFRIRGNATPCCRLLTLLSLPNLDSLELHSVDTFDAVTIPTLRSLVLDTCSFSESELESIVRAFPSVVTLSIDDYVPQIYMLLGSDDQPPPWPALEEVHQRDLLPVDSARLCLFLLGRVRSQTPLRRVYLDRRSRTVLRAKGSSLSVLSKVLLVQNRDDLLPWPADLGYEDPDDIWRF